MTVFVNVLGLSRSKEVPKLFTNVTNDHSCDIEPRYRNEVRCKRVWLNWKAFEEKNHDRFKLEIGSFMPEYPGWVITYRWHKTYEYGNHFLIEFYGDFTIYNKFVILFYTPTRMARAWFSFVKNGHFYAFNIKNLMYHGTDYLLISQHGGPRISREEFERLELENKKFNKKHFRRGRSFHKHFQKRAM